MDNKRASPFKVGDRVENKKRGYIGNFVGVGPGVNGRATSFVDRDDGVKAWEAWTDYLTLIATEPEAQEAKYKVGDRVRHKQFCFIGTVVDANNVRPDDVIGAEAVSTHGLFDGCWRIYDMAKGFTLITTEPVAFTGKQPEWIFIEEETGMLKAYEWIIWGLDEAGERTGIESQSGLAMPFKSAENAKLWAWQQYATTGQDPDSCEVQVVPFGG